MTYDSEVMADAPVIYLKLDETSGTTSVDSSGNGNTFTYQSGVSLNQPSVTYDGGTAVKASGTAAACLRNSVPGGLSGAFTVEVWVNITSTNQKGAFVKVGTTGTGYGIGVGGTTLDNTGNTLIGISEAIAWINTGYTLGTGFKHIVMTRDGSNVFRFYVNGTLVYTSGGISINAPTTTISVGGYTAAGNDRFLPSTETIDNVAIYATQLSASRVISHYLAGRDPAIDPAGLYRSAVIADGPLIYLRLGDPAGSAAIDSSGNSRHGTYLGGLTNGVAGLLAGDTSKACSFNGGSSVQVPDGTWMDPSTIAIEFLAKPSETGYGVFKGIASHDGYGTGAGAVNAGWAVGMPYQGKIEFRVTRAVNDGYYTAITPNNALVLNTISHVVCRFDGSYMKVFINGVESASTALTGTLNDVTGGFNMSVGAAINAYGAGSPFEGVLDEFAVYTNLSDAKILEHAQIALGLITAGYSGWGIRL